MSAPGREGAMPVRSRLIGAAVGAALGGIGRIALAAYHVHGLSRDFIPVIVIVAVIGVILGGLAGMTARPGLGAVVGAILSAVAYIGMLPVALLMEAIAVGRASLAEVVVLGALAGAIGGAAGRAARRP